LTLDKIGVFLIFLYQVEKEEAKNAIDSNDVRDYLIIKKP
jgi:hypothetical protein